VLPFVVKSLVTLIPTVFVVVLVVFMVTRLVPGDPAAVILGDRATQESLEAVRRNLGIDRPVHEQLVTYLAGLVRGDFGTSIATGRPALAEVTGVFPYTLSLAIFGIALACLIGIPLGTLAATQRGKIGDLLTMIVAMIGVSTPVFVVAMVLILVFSANLQWFPAIGVGERGNIVSQLRHLALPVIALGVQAAAVVARITRSSMLDVLTLDYIRTARSKGLVESTVVYKHALRNALVQVTTVTGTEFSRMLGGAVVLETMFARTGLGKLLVDAIYQRDYPQIQAAVLFFAVVVILVNALVDVLYSFINPRIRYA
jgi:peptide/nickel transport system permease protein